ncbi:MAG: IS1182 family transposase [Terrimesophilobacter sp.]
MQGRDDGQRQLLDVQSWAGHLLPAGSVFAFLAAHRHELFPDDAFADLFPSGRGRPSIPADVIASVLVLQTIHNLSDRETADAVTFDLRWKAACGFAVTQTAFHSSVLTYWRRRLAASDRPHRIFDAVTAVIAQSGALAGRRRRAVDSTILDDAVARQDTVTQLVAQIRRVGREIPAAGVVVAGLSGHDYSRPGKPNIAWDDAAARDELVSRLVADARTVLSSIDAEVLTGTQQEAVALLALVAGQDVEPAEGSDGTDGRWRIARKVAPDRVISTVDPETRHAHKSREKKQDGFKAHIVIEPDTGLVTAVALTKAAGRDNSDGARGAELIAADTSIGDGPVEVLGDSAYGTGSMLAAVTAAGHIPVIKPMPLSRAVAGGFTIDDFTVDESAGTATCPAGVTRRITLKRRVTFGAACSACPLKAQCTTSTRGRKLELHPQHRLQREHRVRATDPAFQAVYRQHRPMVERSIGWMTRGARRVPYRGVTKNNAWWATRAAGINLKRLLNLGLTGGNGTWVLG